jgi:hypothetical protein
MVKHPTRQALQNTLHTAFDVAYMAVLEEDKVSLDTDIQQHFRELIVNEVYAVLWDECQRMSKSAAETEQHFCAHGFREVSRRLRQELQEEDKAGNLPPEISARMVLLPAFETLES